MLDGITQNVVKEVERDQTILQKVKLLVFALINRTWAPLSHGLLSCKRKISPGTECLINDHVKLTAKSPKLWHRSVQ